MTKRQYRLITYEPGVTYPEMRELTWLGWMPWEVVPTYKKYVPNLTEEEGRNFIASTVQSFLDAECERLAKIEARKGCPKVVKVTPRF